MTDPYYTDESVTLYLGDCREVRAWLEADVLVTDPPYGIGWSKGEDKRNGSRPHAGIVNDEDTTMRDAALALMGDKPGAVFGSFLAPPPANTRHVLVWQKPADAGLFGCTTPYRRDVEAVFLTGKWPTAKADRSSVIRSRMSMVGGQNSPAGRTGHPHSKPLDLMEQLIAACPPGVVADPFAGSGATLLASRAQGRRSIGVEIDERYCEVIARRLNQLDLFGGVA